MLELWIVSFLKALIMVKKNQNQVESKNASEKKQVENILIETAEEVVESRIKSVSLIGASVTIQVEDKFHSQVREWDSDNQEEILHNEVVESSVIYNLFNLYIAKVETDREYLISKTFLQLRAFFEKNRKVAEMPPFIEALLLGAKVVVMHNLVAVEDSDVPRLKTFVVIEEAEKPLPQMMIDDINEWEPTLWTKTSTETSDDEK